MGIADLLSSLEPKQDEDGPNVWVTLPPGYLPLPVENPIDRLNEAEPVLAELCPPDRQELLYATLNTFAVLLTELERRNTVYCGLGWHLASDGAMVSSTLVVSLQQTGEERNPRLVLGDLVKVAADADDQAQADLVDMPAGPALFFESVRSLPRPELPGQQGDPGRADVYQLEVVVPSEKGELLAVLEFSTPQVEYGTQYREMMVLLASTVSFTPLPGSGAENASSQQIHNLLGGPNR